MARRYLKIRAHHAVGLKPIEPRIGRMKPFVTIGIVGHGFHPTPQETKPDKEGHTDPVWESHHMLVELPQDAFDEGGSSLYNLVAKIKHQSHVKNRLIGKVTIPLRDLLVHGEIVGYPVMKSENPHGKLYLSHSLVAAAAAGEDDVATLAPSPRPSAQALLPPGPTTNPLVRAAAVTTIVDNVRNIVMSFTEFGDN